MYDFVTYPQQKPRRQHRCEHLALLFGPAAQRLIVLEPYHSMYQVVCPVPGDVRP